MKISPGKLWGMRRLANEAGVFVMTALDQRPPIMNPIKAKRRTPAAPDGDVAAVKRVIAQELATHSSALLVDPIWAYSQSIELIPANKGLILTLEDHRFEDSAGGRKSSNIPHWSVEKIRRIGGDAVKVLAWYRPDASAEIIAHQKDYVRAIGQECRRLDIPFVFELLVYPFQNSQHDYVEDAGKRPEMVIDSVAEFAAPEFGVDIFKLESPIPAKLVPQPGNAATQELFDRLGEVADRPWVMLSAGAGKEDFKRVLAYAFKAGASGFLAGRAIWADSFTHWPDLETMAADLRQTGAPYLAELSAMATREATPLMAAKGLRDGVEIAGGGFDLPESYAGLS